jgi:hypothetical protein
VNTIFEGLNVLSPNIQQILEDFTTKGCGERSCKINKGGEKKEGKASGRII